MVVIGNALAQLSPDIVSLFYTTDPFLADLPILAFHGPCTTGNVTQNSSRIQLHIFSAAGFESYSRLTISPSSTFYNVVDHLPRDQQGDEVARGLAFGLLKYFKELPEVVKTNLILQSAHSRSKKPVTPPTLFGESHAASLAAAMVQVDNIAEVIMDLEAALQMQTVSHVDVDLVLPPGTIEPHKDEEVMIEGDDDDSFAVDSSLRTYGEYAPLIKLFGDPCFLPTSKLRRAPSKASSLNRSKSFLKAQKLSLRREMGEFVDTEERYVIKVHELVNHMAEEFREGAKHRSAGGSSPSEQDIQKLFPESLDRILKINTDFLAAIQRVMDETEEEAMQDLEADQANFRASRYGATRPRDLTGAVAFAKVLLEWFPRFSECYQDYIRASQEFPKFITIFIKQNSSFSQRVQQTGEQKLRSAIIEPVQRLPRYSLFIDNIVNYLPLTHPALQPMLKARDVITTICSLDPPNQDKSVLITRLRNLIELWPANLFPQGRLITAVDFSELAPPFLASSSLTTSSKGILLLFADTVIILKKSRDSNLSARGLLMEVDKPSAEKMMASMTAGAGGQHHVYDVSLQGWHKLSETRFSEANEGRVTFMTSLHGNNDGQVKTHVTSPAEVHAYLLQGAYDGKASKWTEEVTKARVEGRFSEKERESDRWCLRNVSLVEAGLNVFAAVFEEGIDSLIKGRREPAPIRIVVDHDKGTKGAPIGHYGIEIVASVHSSAKAALNYKLEVAGLRDRVSVDSVDASSFMQVFSKRVGELLRAHFHSGNPSLTAAFISHYSTILTSMTFQVLGSPAKESMVKPQRPSSPVKMLSSFLNGGGSLGYSAAQKQSRTPVLGSLPTMQPPALLRKGSKASEISQEIVKPPSRSGAEEIRPENNLIRLEETLTAYIAALQLWKGNVVGRIVRSRGSADELQVNALYNMFIENPFDTRASSEATFDVLFCAFEKYLHIVWRDQMGPVIALQTLQLLQEKNAALFPGDFAEFLKLVFADMAPQNKRAFVGMIKCLADLLDGCGNDGDRGAITAAFAELLVSEGDPHDFINLLDRLVEDSDSLFDGIGPESSTGFNTPNYGSVNSTLRSGKSFNKDGSITSNTSLRKRFGFDTLLRQNSKNDSDTRPSMWRSLSKANKQGLESGNSSISKGSAINRSKSIDAGNGGLSPKRPGSRDRPTLLGAFEERPLERPASSHLNQVSNRLSTIQSSPPPEPASETKSKKKSRRSSLSDLMKAHTIESSPATPPVPATLRRTLAMPQSLASIYNTSPRTPSPPKQSIMDRSIKWNPDPPNTKENSPMTVTLSPRNPASLKERPRNIMSPPADETIVICSPNSTTTSSIPKPSSRKVSATIPLLSSRSSHLPTPSHSTVTSPPARPKSSYTPKTTQLPTPRPQSSHVTKSTDEPTGRLQPVTSQRSSPQKLRLQNTAKLRERLAKERQATSKADSTLQSEIARISTQTSKALNQALDAATTEEAQTQIKTLQSSLRELESTFLPLMQALQASQATTQASLDSSLAASEYKVQALDQMVKEASAENELLYERFNGELGRIVKAVRGKGDGREELVGAVREAREEVGRVRRENVRLKREVAGLRGLLKGIE